MLMDYNGVLVGKYSNMDSEFMSDFKTFLNARVEKLAYVESLPARDRKLRDLSYSLHDKLLEILPTEHHKILEKYSDLRAFIHGCDNDRHYEQGFSDGISFIINTICSWRTQEDINNVDDDFFKRWAITE